MAKNKVL